MVKWAEKYVGIPYKLHSRKMSGCDCYGIISIIYKNEFGIDIPVFDDEYNVDTSDEELLEIFERNLYRFKEVFDKKVGDIVYFVVSGMEKHVGLLVGDNHFIHNLKKGGSSTIADLNSPKWKRRVIGIYRYE